MNYSFIPSVNHSLSKRFSSSASVQNISQSPARHKGSLDLFLALKVFPNGSAGKESACDAGDKGDVGLILGSGRSPGEGNGNPLQYSCLENPMDRGAWKAIDHRVEKSPTRLSTWHIALKEIINKLIYHSVL